MVFIAFTMTMISPLLPAMTTMRIAMSAPAILLLAIAGIFMWMESTPAGISPDAELVGSSLA